MERNKWLAFAGGLALMPSVGLSQSGRDNSGEGVLEEITVTAERKEADLQSVPISVTALSEAALESRQVTEARDLQRYVPSLRMSNNITSPTNISPSLRGSLQQDASLVVAESPFGIYVDDVYIARLNGNNITLSDIERVEVLRGPQGTLYGRNTLAGAIKFISRTPNADNAWFDVKAGVGNWGQFVASLSTGGKLSDNWAASFSAQSNRKGGQVTNLVTGKHVGEEENLAGRVKLHYIGGERFDAVFSLAYADSTNDSLQLVPGISPSVPANQRYTSDDVFLPNGDYANRTVYNNVLPAIIGKKPRGETKQTIAAANLSWDMGAYTIRSITGYVKMADFFSTDFSGEGQVLGASNPTARQYSEELQITGKAMDDKLDYLAGVYWFDEKGSQDFGWNITRAFFNAGPVSSSTSNATSKSVSVFGQGSYQFTDQFKATLGARWTRDKKTFDMRWVPLFPFLASPITNISLRNTYTEVTPKFGLDYQVNSDAVDSLLLYFSAARGFKSGGYNGIAITSPEDSKSAYGPESNWTYEVGAKMDSLDNRFRLNANYFVAKIKDLTLNATVIDPMTGVASFPVQNSGKVTVQGLEVESTFVATDNLTFFMNASILTGKYNELNPTSAPAVASLPRLPLFVNNNRLGVQAEPPQLPDKTISLGLDYAKPFGDNKVFRFGADWYKTDDYITAATNDFVITGYDRFNTFLGLDIGDNWETRLAVKNVANEKKIYVGSRGFLGGYLQLPPAEIMFTAKYKMAGDKAPPPVLKPADSDGDGVTDDIDRCPGTPAGTAVDASGCPLPLDSDGDGVVDANDKCPNTPAGTKVDASGCELDDDGDGVANSKDQCPMTPAGAKVDAVGCELDDDGDGVVNSKDQCADTPKGDRVDSYGCSFKTELKLPGVVFETNSAELKAESLPILEGAVATLKRYPELIVEVAGHTDSDASDGYNLALSKRRAETVMKYLTDNGAANSLKARGYGERQPVASNKTDEGKAQNRRVVLRILNK